MRRPAVNAAAAVLAAGVAGSVFCGCAGAEQHGNATQRVSAWVGDSSIGETVGTLEGDNGRIAAALRRHVAPNTLHAGVRRPGGRRQ